MPTNLAAYELLLHDKSRSNKIMNWDKYNVLLEKLNNLHAQLEKYEEVSDAEKDLMMNYLRSMHNVLGEDREEVQELGGITHSNGSNGKAAPMDDTPEVIDESPELIEESIIEKEPIPEPVEVVAAAEQISPGLLEIFETTEVLELSDKLKMMPITDLTKAVSINEKAFTIKELFGGDSDLFTKTLHNLNIMGSFEEAKEFLIHGVAKDNEWEAKAGKAVQFIQLVQRRYK